jgi:hypothetical protein
VMHCAVLTAVTSVAVGCGPGEAAPKYSFVPCGVSQSPYCDERAATDLLDAAVEIDDLTGPLLNSARTFGYRLHVRPTTRDLDPFLLEGQASVCASPCESVLWIAEGGSWVDDSDPAFGDLVWSRTEVTVVQLDASRVPIAVMERPVELAFKATPELLREASTYTGSAASYPQLVIRWTNPPSI